MILNKYGKCTQIQKHLSPWLSLADAFNFFLWLKWVAKVEICKGDGGYLWQQVMSRARIFQD